MNPARALTKLQRLSAGALSRARQRGFDGLGLVEFDEQHPQQVGIGPDPLALAVSITLQVTAHTWFEPAGMPTTCRPGRGSASAYKKCGAVMS